MSDVLTLPLDPTGKATTNDITGEIQTIGTNPVRAFASNFGAFFASSLTLLDHATGEPLTGSQFFTAIVFDLATAKYGAALNDTLVGVVVITDPSVSDTVVASYQALGGGFQQPLTGIVSDLIQYEPASRPANWPNVIDRLSVIPASQALHDSGQAGLITFEYVVHALDRMTQLAIMGDPLTQQGVEAYANAMETSQISGLGGVLATLSAHEANTQNPHQTTAALVGAMAFAQQDAAIAAEAALRVTEDNQLTATLSAHETNFNNPHVLTLAQLGMYASAQVSSAIAAAQVTLNNTLAANQATVSAHVNNLNNPHDDSTTSLGTLTVSQIQTAIANATSAVALSATTAASALNAHTTNTDNPHTVTPAQIGTWAASALQALQTALLNHIANLGNPHEVNIVQIGGMTQAQFNAALSAVETSLSGFFTSNFNAIVNHINNTNNPHGDSAEAMGALGPWNLGTLENDLVNFQAQINATEPPPPPPTCCGGGGGGIHFSVSCFIAGTKVLMADYSWKNIEDIQPDDMLMSPTGPARCHRLHTAVLGTGRALLTMQEDPSTRWVADHPLWSRNAQGKQWWWSGDAAYMRAEVEGGLTQGLKDINSVFEGEVEYAHLNGFVKRTPVVVEGADPETLVYIPVLEGPPCIVNGYVAAAFFNEWKYDYTQLDWEKLHPAHWRELQNSLIMS